MGIAQEVEHITEVRGVPICPGGEHRQGAQHRDKASSTDEIAAIFVHLHVVSAAEHGCTIGNRRARERKNGRHSSNVPANMEGVWLRVVSEVWKIDPPTFSLTWIGAAAEVHRDDTLPPQQG